MNGENELPEGWTTAILKDITIDVKNVKPENEPNRVFEYVDISSINNQTYTIEEVKSFFGKDAPSRARRPIKKDDILFSNVRTYLRNISIVPEKYDNQLCSTGFTVLRPSSCILSKYLFYFVLTDSFIEQVSPQQRGSQYPATSDGVVKSVPILLPPLAEQRRIVAAVEALLARVNASRERLDRVPGFLKAFRQAVLAAACSGRLTEGWRGVMNLEPDKNSLLETIELINKERNDIPRNKKIKSTNNIEVNFNIPEIWCKVSLKEISYKITDGEHATPKRSESGYYLLSARNVLDGKISLNNVDYVPFEEFTRIRKRCNPDKGDILISCSGTIGRVTVVDKDNSYVMVRSAALVKPFFSIINPKYLEFILRSQILQDQMGKRAKATAQSNLFIGEIEKLVIPLAPLEEQEEIVRRVEALFALADHIEQRVAIGKERADRLTQAILAKAFRGELVPTEAELARRAGREYEPASVLLERIRMDRESPGERKPRTRGIRSTKGVQ